MRFLLKQEDGNLDRVVNKYNDISVALSKKDHPYRSFVRVKERQTIIAVCSEIGAFEHLKKHIVPERNQMLASQKFQSGTNSTGWELSLEFCNLCCVSAKTD